MKNHLLILELDNDYYVDIYMPKSNSCWMIYCNHGEYTLSLVQLQDALVGSAKKKGYKLQDRGIVKLFSNNDSFDKIIQLEVDEHGLLKAKLLHSNFQYGKDFSINGEIVQKGNNNW